MSDFYEEIMQPIYKLIFSPIFSLANSNGRRQNNSYTRKLKNWSYSLTDLVLSYNTFIEIKKNATGNISSGPCTWKSLVCVNA